MKLSIGHMTWTVAWLEDHGDRPEVREIVDPDTLRGVCLRSLDLILIDRTLQPGEQVEVLFHELAHAAAPQMVLTEFDAVRWNEEAACTLAGRVVAQVLNQNPGLLAILQACLTKGKPLPLHAF